MTPDSALGHRFAGTRGRETDQMSAAMQRMTPTAAQERRRRTACRWAGVGRRPPLRLAMGCTLGHVPAGTGDRAPDPPLGLRTS